MKKHINIKPNLGRMRLFIFTALMLVMSHIAFAQAIQVLNIPDTGNRGNLPSNAKGYHLSATTSTGANMVNAKAKLTSVANFGPSGIVNRQLQITDGLGNRGDITSISQLNAYSIIYIGAYVRTDTSPSIFTPTEINILLAWSKQPGKVLMVQEQSASSAYPQANPISTAMGYGITNSSAYPNTSVLPADTEQNTKLFSGVFGTASGSITQNGSAKGHFNAGCAGIPLAGNTGNFPTILLNQEYRDILVADTDFFTYLTGSTPATYMSPGSGISTNADKVWANLWAWAVNEVVNQVAPNTNVTLGGEAYSDDLPICTGTTSITVKLRYNNAPVLRWQTSTDGGNTIIDIANTTSTLVYNNPVAGQMFRAVVKNVYPTCTETTSTVLTLTANNTAPTVTSGLTNVCPATTVNLADAQTSTAPAGTQIVWFNNNGHSGTPLTAAQIANAPAGTYYAYYQSTSNATCFSPASSGVTVTINSCNSCNPGTVSPNFNNLNTSAYAYFYDIPDDIVSYRILCGGGNTANLTLLTPRTMTPASPVPTGATITWHSSPIATEANQITDPLIAVTGATKNVYAAFRFSAECYSPTRKITIYAPICANEDDFTATPVFFGVGGTLSPSIFANDTFKGQIVELLGPNSVNWLTESWVLMYAQVDLTNSSTYGALTISPNTPIGNYTYIYSIVDNSPDGVIGSSKSPAVVKFRVVCVAGETAPTVNNAVSNICPATTVNLETAHTGTKPAGTDLVWFTSNNTATGTQLTAAQVMNAGAGTYYAFYYSSSGNCYSPASNAVTVTINNCNTPTCTNSGVTSVDLNLRCTGTLPTNVVLQWWKTADRTPGTQEMNPTAVSANGTYYAFFYDTIGFCYNTNNSTATVTVNILPSCACTKPGNFPSTLTPNPTKVGITVQEKQDGWPENIRNGFMVLESKTKGFVITRVATVGDNVDGTPTATDSVTQPKEGMLVYNIADSCTKLFSNGKWKCIVKSCND